jgi:hypothetical protein
MIRESNAVEKLQAGRRRDPILDSTGRTEILDIFSLVLKIKMVLWLIFDFKKSR